MADPFDTVYEPVSLGLTCEVKFQISRVLYFRKFPNRSEASFRLTLMGPTLGSHMFGWGLFDWQSAPIDAVCAYLERDFQGVFEREDLEIENNEVVHKTLRTNHIHEFENIRRDGVVLPEMVDVGYPSVRKKFDRLVDKFREHLKTPGDFLYVSSDRGPTADRVGRLVSLLQARSAADHRFHLLLVPFADEQVDMSSLAGRVTVAATRPREPNKAAAMRWEGDDAAWDAALAPFKLNLEFGPSGVGKPAAKAEPDAETSAPRGLLSRLFAR
jgi:hypothetical protein